MRPFSPGTAGLVFFVLAFAGTASAQDYLGVTKCANCHKVAKKAWQDSHAQTLAQLQDPKAATFARATGGDANHPKCLACHAPVTLAAGPAPVSCESCHGAGKAYLAPHQELPFYSQPQAQWMGLRDLQKNPREIARICVSCHVLDDAGIAAAGHPTGATFDAGRELASPKMAHWPSGSVDETRVRAHGPPFYGSVTREGAPLVAARASKVGKTAVAATGKPAAPMAAAAKPPAAAKAGASAGASPGADEYADLGDDEFVAPAAASAPPRPIKRLALPDPPSGAFDAPPVRTVTAPTPPPPPVAAPPAGKAPLPPSPPPTAKPRGVAEMRGRAALVLADLIRQKKTLDVPAPAPPAEFAGPDGELLRLQDEALVLALETLRGAR
jgi:hypothetical protein